MAKIEVVVEEKKDLGPVRELAKRVGFMKGGRSIPAARYLDAIAAYRARMDYSLASLQIELASEWF